MSKRLPYFQFEPAEWLAGDIMFCTLQAQGLFTTIKALYWQKDCDLLLEQAIKRLKNEDLFEELISEKIIKIKSGKIKINFLDEQWEKLSEKSKINSKNGALGGRPKNEIKPLAKPNGKPKHNLPEDVNINENEVIGDTYAGPLVQKTGDKFIVNPCFAHKNGGYNRGESIVDYFQLYTYNNPE